MEKGRSQSRGRAASASWTIDDAVLTHSQGIKQPVYRSLVFHNPRLLDAFHKLLQLHVFFRQLEALYSTFLSPDAVASTFPLLVPLDSANEPFQLRTSVGLCAGSDERRRTF